MKKEHKILENNNNPKTTKTWLEYIQIHRFKALIIAALLGILSLFIFVEYCQEYFGGLFQIERNSGFMGAVALLVLGLPVVIVLWFFKTYDIKTQIEKAEKQIEKSEEQIAQAEKQIEKSEERIAKSEEQIEKSEEQIHQASYFKGLDHLASNDVLKTAIGVRELVALRKITKQYDKDILTAFEKLFQLRKAGNDRVDLKKIDFSEIYLSEGDLSGADLSRADFSKADFSYANLTFAGLSRTNLIAADFSYANLMVADLSGANLKEAEFMEANLSRTNFNKAKNLEHAYFEGASYAISFPPKNIDFEVLGYSLEAEELDGNDVVRISKPDD